MKRNDLPRTVLGLIRAGAVIPAAPLALNSRRQFDERRQRALMRYYIDAGVDKTGSPGRLARLKTLW